MKMTVKFITATLAMMCSIAFAKSANAKWASVAVEKAVLQDSNRILHLPFTLSPFTKFRVEQKVS